MVVDLKVPAVGESITEAFVNRWYKTEGEFVQKDETIAELETEKATFELPSPVAGMVSKIMKDKGATVKVGETIGQIEEGAAAPGKGAAAGKGGDKTSAKKDPANGAAPESKESAPAAASRKEDKPSGEATVMPAAQRLMDEKGLTAAQVQGTGPGGRILKEDVMRATAAPPQPASEAQAQPAASAGASGAGGSGGPPAEAPDEEVVAMSPMRQTIARRLLEAQHNAALLTTFNEVDMSAIMELRKRYQPDFEKRYGFKLGFMSFFAKAAIDGLKQFPALNAEIRGTNIIYRNHYDIGIAVSTDRGLVVPVVRNVERLSFAEIENQITDYAQRARGGKLAIHELQGGTFTITNGGIFGSLLSTPIVNPPQSGVLGMHAIQDRPVARDGQVVIRPMMYLALTYDHRIVDGREAVTFLRRMKETLEDPARMLVEV